MQTSLKGTYSGMVHCATGIMKNEGPLAFYKVPTEQPASKKCVDTFTQGTLTPLLGIGVCVSIQFGVLEASKRYFARQNILRGKGGDDGLLLSGDQLLLGGVLAGLGNGVVSGPVEHIRIRKPSSLVHLRNCHIVHQGYKPSRISSLRTLVPLTPSRKFIRHTGLLESTKARRSPFSAKQPVTVFTSYHMKS